MESHPFRFLRHLGRVRQIATVLVTYGFGDLIERLGFRRYVEWGKRRLFQQPETSGLTTPRRLRMAFEKLGPTFIKFGQVLSTRPDLLPADFIDELSRLQEDVPTFDGEQAIGLLEEELRHPLADLFRDFDRTPLAAGSLAQVHRAIHPDGTVLAIKIRRPNAVQDVERDLALMAEAAPLFAQIPQLAVFDPIGLVSHFTRSIRRELSFRREGRTLEEFRKLFRHDATLYVPRVYDELTTDAILTMEYIDGCRADDLEAVAARNLSAASIARNGARIYMKQVFEFGLFHGDPHPGNIRILSDGSLALLDYGMVGVLSDNVRDRLIDLFVAISRNNVDKVTTLVLAIGQPHWPVDLVLLKADVHDLLERYYGIPLEQLLVGRLLSDFTTLLAEHALQCPADMMLLLRTFITLEGLGLKLDPNFNLAEELAPFVEQVVRMRYDPRRLISKAMEDLGTLLQAAHDLPMGLNRTLQKLSQDELKIQLEHRGIEKLISEFDRSSNRMVVGLITASLVVASALIIRSGSTSTWVMVPIFVLSGFLGIWLIYGILRSGRL
ncbi:MAG: ABC1 kinase family protein [Planctomycetaceae bacterium]